MEISELCQSFILSAGVLMNGEVPAGQELIRQNVIKIAIAEPEPDGQFPENILNSDQWQSALGRLNGLKDLGPILGDNTDYGPITPASFPDNIEQTARTALSQWYDGQIVFVTIDDSPDITLFSYETDNPYIEGGLATFPEHTNEKLTLKGREHQYIALKLSSFTDEADFQGSLGHEFGHNFGILHPFTIAEQLDVENTYRPERDYFRDAFTFHSAQNACEVSYQEIKQEIDHLGFMGYGDQEHASWYDEGAKSIVSGVGPAP